MKTEIFNELIKVVKRDTKDTEIQQIGFIAKYCNYELNFYADEETSHELTIEHCGYTIGSKWYEETLTLEQEEQLQTIIDNEVIEVTNNIKIENLQGFRDSYESTGTSPSDFY